LDKGVIKLGMGREEFNKNVTISLVMGTGLALFLCMHTAYLCTFKIRRKRVRGRSEFGFESFSAGGPSLNKRKGGKEFEGRTLKLP
jgi:hypothetical protein